MSAEGDVRSADPGPPPMGNRAAAGQTKGVCEAIEGAGRANPPGNRDGGGKADKPDDRETGRRPHDLTPGGARGGKTAPQTNLFAAARPRRARAACRRRDGS
jgi:hypothetical protein